MAGKLTAVMMGFVAIIGVLLLADMVTWWLGTRWLKRYGAGRAAMWACHAFFAMQAAYAATLLGFALFGSAGVGLRARLNWVPVPLQALVFVWHLFFLPISLLVWLVTGSVVTGRRLVRLAAAVATPVGSSNYPKGMTRRSLLLASVAAVPPLLSIGATGYGLSQTWKFRLSRMRMPVVGLPAGLEGFRIAHVSDLHVGRWSTRSFLNDVIEQTNALKADIILFTGDLIDVSIGDLPVGVDVIKRLRATHGVFLIEGNHDLMDDPARFRAALPHEGLRFLRGSAQIVEHWGTALQILGLPWTRREDGMAADVRGLASLREPGAFPILLAHHPHAFDPAAAAGFPITLAGHTHGGLLALNREVNAGSMMFRYISGLYQKAASNLIVSNGTGNWIPLRLGAPAEIIEITLTQGRTAAAAPSA